MLEQTNTWHQIESCHQNEVHPPCPRSLHASVAVNNNFYIFGGYDGTNRRNDFFCFNFTTNTWSELNPNGSPQPPSPRDRHTAVVHGRNIYIFGGYDGYNRVDDFHKYCIQTNTWQQLEPLNPDAGPSPRHSHSSVVNEDHMYVFGGYDGHYRNDLYKYNYKTNMWQEIRRDGMWPKSRYRTSATVLDNKMYLFGGHDGARQLNDFYFFNF
jgi:N-acetylneuraminic acid mutarotase